MSTVSDLQFNVSSAPDPTRLRVDMIRRDGGTQMRVDLNQEAVAAYAERLEAGDIFPAVVVFYDGAAHWMADGFHRVAASCLVASKKAGTAEHDHWTTIRADVRSGTRQDAIRFAISANRTNGLRRTNADKQIAVRAALSHPSMSGMSDRAIAEEAGVSHLMVAQHRQVATVATSTQPSIIYTKSDSVAANAARTRQGVDGKKYPVRPPTTKATAATKPPSKTPEERRESDRVRMAARRAAVSGDSPTKRQCPMCKGKGHLND